MSKSLFDEKAPVLEAPREGLEKEIAKAISGIRYGAVEIIIHDGVVVQIERKEKVRFVQKGPKAA